MIKKELVSEIAKRTEIPYDDIQEVVNLTTIIIKEQLQSGGKAILRRFGKFSTKVRGEKVGRIGFDKGQSGKQIFIESRKKVVFTPSKEFIELING